MLKGAIVGLGYIAGAGHLPAYLAMRDVRIVAACDITPARLAWARARVPGIRAYATHEELLASEPDLDFIDIAAPPAAHAAIAQAAVARGLHVLCEKPLTTTIDDARDLLLAAARRRVVVFPCHNYKHAPVVRAVQDVLQSGAIGEVTAATLSTFRPTHAKGVPEWLPDWRRVRRHAGGGIAMDHGSHSFYLLFLFMGGFPSSVSARTMSADPAWDTEDSVAASLAFESGLASVFLTWRAGARRVMYAVHGARGAIHISDDDLEIVTAAGSERRVIPSAWGDASHVGWFTALFRAFQAAIERRDFISRDLREAYMCVQLSERVHESAADGGRSLSIDSSFDFLRGEAGAIAPPEERAIGA